MGIESVGSRGAIQPVHDEETAPSAATAEKAASSGPPPAKDEVVEAKHSEGPSWLAGHPGAEWLEHHLEVGGALGGAGGEWIKPAAEESTAAEAGNDSGIRTGGMFGKAPTPKLEAELKLADTGDRSLKHFESGDARNGASLQLGYGRAAATAGIERQANGAVTGEIGASAKIAVAHGEVHATQTLGRGPNAIVVKEQVVADLLAVQAQGKLGFKTGPEGAEGKFEVGAQAMAAEVRAHATATIHLGDDEIGSLGFTASGGLGAAVQAEVEGKMSEGHLGFHSTAGAAVGLGGKAGLDVDINTIALAHSVKDGRLPGLVLATAASLEAGESGLVDGLGHAAAEKSKELEKEGHSFTAGALGMLALVAKFKAGELQDEADQLQRGAEWLVKK